MDLDEFLVTLWMARSNMHGERVAVRQGSAGRAGFWRLGLPTFLIRGLDEDAIHYGERPLPRTRALIVAEEAKSVRRERSA